MRTPICRRERVYTYTNSSSILQHCIVFQSISITSYRLKKVDRERERDTQREREREIVHEFSRTLTTKSRSSRLVDDNIRETERDEMKLVLGYWDIRGLAAPIRLMCAFTGFDLEEVRYTQEEKEKWFREKPTLGLAFPNLPYLIVKDDDGTTEVMRITQSQAILHYVAKKLKLYGTSDEEAALADMIVAESVDFRGKMSALCYQRGTQFSPENKAAFLETTVPAFLASVEGFARGDGSWIAGGSTPTFADFYLYCELEKLTLFSAGVLDTYPKLAAFVTRFEALETIAAYIRSPKHIEWPIYGAMAAWGGGGPCPRTIA